MSRGSPLRVLLLVLLCGVEFGATVVVGSDLSAGDAGNADATVPLKDALAAPGMDMETSKEKCSLVLNLRGSYVLEGIFVMNRVELHVPDLKKWFDENVFWHCACTNDEERGTCVSDGEEKFGVKLQVQDEDDGGGGGGGGSPRQRQPKQITLWLNTGNTFFHIAKSVQARYSHITTGSHLTLVVQESPDAIKDTMQATLSFTWLGRNLTLDVDSSKAYNWLRFTGSLAWPKYMADTLVHAIVQARSAHFRDSELAQNAAAQKQQPCPFSIRYLDIGAGSGFNGILIAATLQVYFPNVCLHVVMTDVTDAATQLIRLNVAKNTGLEAVVTVLQGDMFHPLHDHNMTNYFDAVHFYPPQVSLPAPRDSSSSRSTNGQRCPMCGPDPSMCVSFVCVCAPIQFQCTPSCDRHCARSHPLPTHDHSQTDTSRSTPPLQTPLVQVNTSSRYSTTV